MVDQHRVIGMWESRGHPDFPYRFKDADEEVAKRKAQQLAAKINKKLKVGGSYGSTERQ